MFTPLPNGDLRLDEDFTVSVWDVTGITIRVTVPKGFTSDGASIPAILWPIIGPPMGSSHLIPAVVHDYLCVSSKTYPQRIVTDAIFFWLLKEYNVPYWKRCAMYLAVRWFGRFIWVAGSEHAKVP